MMNGVNRLLISLLAGMGVSMSAHAVEVSQYPALQKLVDTMVAEDGYPRAELEAVLAGAKVDQKTIDLMNRQYEALPWHRYRDLFINEARIAKGVTFWEEHRDILASAEEQYGIPQEIMVALFCVWLAGPLYQKATVRACVPPMPFQSRMSTQLFSPSKAIDADEPVGTGAGSSVSKAGVPEKVPSNMAPVSEISVVPASSPGVSPTRQ